MSWLYVSAHIVTKLCLQVVDEFGKGTSPASGISLFTAMLRQLCKIRCKAVCTTHFIEIFSTGCIKDGHDGIKALQMAVKIPAHKEDNAVPLFKLEDGIANSSAGILCARMAGVERSVLNRASAIVAASKNQRQVTPEIDILCGSHGHVEIQVELVRELAAAKWGSASDRQVDSFMYKIAKLKLKLQS
jgi:DNA mismatch repair protein MSH5